MITSQLVSSSGAMIGLILAAMAFAAAVETIVPLHPRAYWHRFHVAPNLALTFITFATNLVFNSALVVALVRLESTGWSLLSSSALHPALVIAITVATLDFAFYAAHVCMHKVPMLWRFHVVHHSDPVVDVTTTVRQHPGESVLRYVFMSAAALAIGAPPSAFAVYRVWSALAGLLEHANVRWPTALDDALALVISTPNFHKVHHSRLPEHADTNYGNCVSLFDTLFRTRTPAVEGLGVVCGVEGMDDPASQSTAALLALPFRSADAGVTVAAGAHEHA